MPLVDIPLQCGDVIICADVARFLGEAQGRIDAFQQDSAVPGFVPCDAERAWRCLHTLADQGIAKGNLFCEWGSGFGVVSCLAALLGFEAVGIEINRPLVDAARRLADDFNIPASFIHGSFIPPGETIDSGGGFSWLETARIGANMQVGPEDFDVIFAYPWPAEEAATEALFERRAAHGALLLCCRGGADFRLRRKIARRRSR